MKADQLQTVKVNGLEFSLPLHFSQMRPLKHNRNSVCAAYDEKNQRWVAVRKHCAVFEQLREAEGAFRELSFLYTHRHQNIAEIFFAFSPDSSIAEFETFYTVTELLEDSLADLKVNGDHKRISHVAYQLLSVVESAHNAGINMLELTSSTVGVREDGTIGVHTFGELGKSPDDLDRENDCLYNRFFQAPEIIMNMSPDEKADMFYIGCTLAHLINGKILFSGRNFSKQWNHIVNTLGTPTREFYNRASDSIKGFISGVSAPPKPAEEIIPDQGFDSSTEQGNVTASAGRSLVIRLLKVDPSERISVQEALADPYLQMWNSNKSTGITQFQIEDLSTINEWKEKLFGLVGKLEKQL